MIDRLYTTQFTNKRTQWVNESSAEVSVGFFVGHIQQSNPQFTAEIGEAWGKTFIVWCDINTNVQIGDSLEVALGSYLGTYSVKNLQIHNYGQSVPHIELIIIKDIE